MFFAAQFSVKKIVRSGFAKSACRRYRRRNIAKKLLQDYALQMRPAAGVTKSRFSSAVSLQQQVAYEFFKQRPPEFADYCRSIF